MSINKSISSPSGIPSTFWNISRINIHPQTRQFVVTVSGYSSKATYRTGVDPVEVREINICNDALCALHDLKAGSKILSFVKMVEKIIVAVEMIDFGSASIDESDSILEAAKPALAQSMTYTTPVGPEVDEPVVIEEVAEEVVIEEVVIEPVIAEEVVAEKEVIIEPVIAEPVIIEPVIIEEVIAEEVVVEKEVVVEEVIVEKEVVIEEVVVEKEIVVETD